MQVSITHLLLWPLQWLMHAVALPNTHRALSTSAMRHGSSTTSGAVCRPIPTPLACVTSMSAAVQVSGCLVGDLFEACMARSRSSPGLKGLPGNVLENQGAPNSL